MTSFQMEMFQTIGAALAMGWAIATTVRIILDLWFLRRQPKTRIPKLKKHHDGYYEEK